MTRFLLATSRNHSCRPPHSNFEDELESSSESVLVVKALNSSPPHSQSVEWHAATRVSTIPRLRPKVCALYYARLILSSCSNGYMDAYLLSESSLFVSSNRFVLKTCGNTTLLCAVKPLFQLISAAFPSNKVTAFFYSHRNFQKPQLQPHPHSSFEDEVRYLDRIFKVPVHSRSMDAGSTQPNSLRLCIQEST
ncbi:S-adenosylmethionine decarboxylase proenzyme-like [Halichondria panicea]|uniref:S-adenosylmethionine decarboxylase proenzyme-like n=1 Tax=Halichondria panicea TaxID=6063 RepID=UPI00312BA255